jgi:SAM-dependent methyltransferase
MINWAIRYQPIIEELRRRNPTIVLDVGSGSEGLSMFWKGKVIGVDIKFKRRPMLLGVCSSSIELPFSRGTFPVVVSSDMLEHVPAKSRKVAVVEMARVCSQSLLIGFPSGSAAAEMYQELASGMKSPLPSWLREHLELGLPDADEVSGWLEEAGWSIKTSWHESIPLHQKIMQLESWRPLSLFTYLLSRLAGPWLVQSLPEASKGDKLRVWIRAAREIAPTFRTVRSEEITSTDSAPPGHR